MNEVTLELQANLTARLQLFARSGIRTADSEVTGVHCVDLTAFPDDVDLLLIETFAPEGTHFPDPEASGCKLFADQVFIVDIDVANFEGGAELAILVWRNPGEDWRVRMAYKGGYNYDARGYTAD